MVIFVVVWSANKIYDSAQSYIHINQKYKRMLTKQFNELNRQADVVTTRVNVADLKPGHSVFGNKGNVWNDTAHIYKHGEGNLCGTPALSSNWALIEDVRTIGCPRCLERYNSQPNNDDYIQQLAQNMVDMGK
jgi:hypothetical protein